MKRRLIVAVSGGVDSVVLLDKLVKLDEFELIVAHFDHGIRPDSADDARFVADLSAKYGVLFETEREELGERASEDLARQRRYRFLRSAAEKYQADISTAHHRNDIAETVAINVSRGTGWRGLACLASDIYRPLLGLNKQEIIDYAERNNLSWREDSTNQSSVYLRNRLRPKLQDDDLVGQLAALRARQVELKREIDREIDEIGWQAPFLRHNFVMMNSVVASEILRRITSGKLTRPQRERLTLAIKTASAGSKFEAGGVVIVYFTPRHFTVQVVQ